MNWRPMADATAQARLGEILLSWEGTRYMPGQQLRGVGTDCVRFVCAVLDELLGVKTPIKTLPPDTCMHDPERAAAAMRRLQELYPSDQVSGAVEPGDVIVTGPKAGGPGHAMIVGDQRNVVWHASAPSVHRVGIGGVLLLGHRVFAAYRLRQRDWR